MIDYDSTRFVRLRRDCARIVGRSRVRLAQSDGGDARASLKHPFDDGRSVWIGLELPYPFAVRETNFLMNDFARTHRWVSITNRLERCSKRVSGKRRMMNTAG